MDIEVNDVSVAGGEVEIDVGVTGYHEVELDERESVTFSVSDILDKIDNDVLLDHVGKDAIKAYADEHDMTLGESTEEFRAETLEKWLRESDSNVVVAMRTLNKVLSA